MPGFADMHAAEAEVQRLEAEVAAVRAKLHGAVRKGKAIDAERAKCAKASEARATRLSQAEQRVAELERELRSAADAAAGDLRAQLSAAAERCALAERGREDARSAAQEALGAQRAAEARGAELLRQLQEGQAQAQAHGAPVRRQIVHPRVKGLLSTEFWADFLWNLFPRTCMSLYGMCQYFKAQRLCGADPGDLAAEAAALREQRDEAAARAAAGDAAAAELTQARRALGLAGAAAAKYLFCIYCTITRAFSSLRAEARQPKPLRTSDAPLSCVHECNPNRARWNAR